MKQLTNTYVTYIITADEAKKQQDLVKAKSNEI